MQLLELQIFDQARFLDTYTHISVTHSPIRRRQGSKCELFCVVVLTPLRHKVKSTSVTHRCQVHRERGSAERQGSEARPSQCCAAKAACGQRARASEPQRCTTPNPIRRSWLKATKQREQQSAKNGHHDKPQEPLRRSCRAQKPHIAIHRKPRQCKLSITGRSSESAAGTQGVRKKKLQTKNRASL